MLQAFENIDSGTAYKLTFLYRFPLVELKVSHARFDLAAAPDRNATDVDVTYNLGHRVKGLSLRYRLELLASASDAVEQSDQRFQLQYLF
jgi:hypothetical protein